MKNLILAAALALVVATPAFAKSTVVFNHSSAVAGGIGGGAAVGHGVVVGGHSQSFTATGSHGSVAGNESAGFAAAHNGAAIAGAASFAASSDTSVTVTGGHRGGDSQP